MRILSWSLGPLLLLRSGWRVGPLGFAVLVGACGSPERVFGEDLKGVEGGACLPNNQCVAGLTCASNLCVAVNAGNPGGTGSGGAPGNSGGAPAATGGAPAASGGMPGTSGGTPASGGVPAATGGAPGTGGGPAQAPVCTSVQVVDAAGFPPETSGAFCLGLAYSDSYSCIYDGVSTTSCSGLNTAYHVDWMADSASPTIVVGLAVDQSDSSLLAAIAFDRTLGSSFFYIEWPDGSSATCAISGDTVELCR
jgi:hypothetical protein